LDKVFWNLGARAIGVGSANAAAAIAEFEKTQSTVLPPRLKDILIEVRSAVVFDRGARFKPDRFSGTEDSKGYHHLEMLYGARENEFGLAKANEIYRARLPKNLLVIGDGPGGDQICLDSENGGVVYWRHDAATEAETSSLIASSFTEFCDKLEPDDAEPLDGGYEVDEAQAYLNF
jgi:hypothetical protein